MVERINMKGIYSLKYSSILQISQQNQIALRGETKSNSYLIFRHSHLCKWNMLRQSWQISHKTLNSEWSYRAKGKGMHIAKTYSSDLCQTQTNTYTHLLCPGVCALTFNVNVNRTNTSPKRLHHLSAFFLLPSFHPEGHRRLAPSTN